MKWLRFIPGILVSGFGLIQFSILSNKPALGSVIEQVINRGYFTDSEKAVILATCFTCVFIFGIIDIIAEIFVLCIRKLNEIILSRKYRRSGSSDK